jgi:alginate O-acetyltransferase complex protein AlgJ
MPQISVRRDWFGALFLVGILVPFVGYLVNLARGTHLRAGMREKPKVELGLQSWSVEQVARLEVFRGWISSSRRVVLGDEGWLFLGDPEVIRGFEGLDPYSPGELGQVIAKLKSTRDTLNAHGIKFLVAVAPEKSSVYDDRLPAYIRVAKGNNATRTSDFVAACSTAGIPLMDLRRPWIAPTIVQALDFQRLDTHWNDMGAMHAAAAIRSKLASMGLSLRAPRFESDWRTVPGGDLARFLGLERVLTETQIYLTKLDGLPTDPRPHLEELYFPEQTIETGQTSLPNLMLFRDSFGTRLAPILARSFNRTTVLWPNKPEVDVARVLREKPDVVVLEFVERKLLDPTPGS